MAVGFPSKTSFTDGVVLSAGELNDISGTLNTVIPTNSVSWTTYSPTLSGGWANGNGTYNVAKYTQIGKTTFVFIQFTLGSTTTKGTDMVVSLPVTAANTFQQGQCRFLIGATNYIGICRNETTTTLRCLVGQLSGSYHSATQITSAIPGAWATGHSFEVSFVYEAA